MDRDKLVIITGATSKISGSVTSKFLKKGYKVVLGYHLNYPTLTNEWEHELDSNLAIKAIDISDQNSIDNFFQAIEKITPLAEVNLVNIAAICPDKELFIEQDNNAIKDIVNVNLVGTFLVSKRYLQTVKKLSLKGGIVNVSSQSSLGAFGLAAYGATKAGLNSFTVALAKEVGPISVRVNCVSPDVINSGLNITLGFNESLRKDKVESIPMNRFGNPDEVASAIFWLISDESSYVSGANIKISGGR